MKENNLKSDSIAQALGANRVLDLKNPSTKLDKIGMALSIGCVMHCILMPFIIPILPMLGLIFGHDSSFHLCMAAIIVANVCLALIPGYVKHKDAVPLKLAVIGVTIVVLAGVCEKFTHSVFIPISTVVGSCYMVAAHYLNHKKICKCKCNKKV